VKPPHSYLVDRRDGSVRKVHANKIRQFVVRVQRCGVIAGKDAEFGRVLTPVPVVSSVLPSQRVDQDKLTHLSVSKRTQLRQLLDEFVDCFVDKPGLRDVITHRIQTTSEFVPRQVRPYRVSAVFKDEVDRRIAELLSMGLIRRSNNPMASPIVCVAKKDGSSGATKSVAPGGKILNGAPTPSSLPFPPLPIPPLPSLPSLRSRPP